MPEPQSPDAESPIPDPPPADPASPERQRLESEASTRCLNCGASLPGAYCPQCGQKDQPLRTPIHRFVVDTLAEYLGLDGRVWPTLWSLLLKPGRLTQAYVVGRRQEYVRPLRIYLTASVAFFFVLALIDPLGKLRELESDSTWEIRSDTTMTAQAYTAHLDSLLQEEAEEDRQRLVRIDSLERQTAELQAAFVSDSLAGRFKSPDSLEAALRAIDDIEDEVDDARDAYQDAHNSTDDRRLQWRREQVEGYRSDSLIQPVDLVVASELAVDGGENEGPTINGPEWLMGGEAMQRLRTARTGDARRDAAWSLARSAVGHLPTVIFLLLPVFALLMKLLYARRGWYYAEHLVFALHTHAFAFVVFTLVAVLMWGAGGAAWAGAATIVVQALIPIYFILAMKRVYAQGWIKTLVKVYLLSWMYFFVLVSGTVLAVGLAAAVG